MRIGSVVKYKDQFAREAGLDPDNNLGVITNLCLSATTDILVFMTDGHYILDIPDRFVVL